LLFTLIRDSGFNLLWKIPERAQEDSEGKGTSHPTDLSLPMLLFPTLSLLHLERKWSDLGGIEKQLRNKKYFTTISLKMILVAKV
jgi:hypothetical protein